jgi:hypothetical protein
VTQEENEISNIYQELTICQKSHFDASLINADEHNKRKVGRPFKGDVEEFTKEPYVPERRSILRGFKKYFSKKDFEDIFNKKSRALISTGGHNLNEIYAGLEETDLKNV